MARRVLFLLGAGAAAANMYDVTNVPRAAPTICAAGCARWSALAEDGQTGVTQDDADAQWAAGKAPEGTGADCAMPGNANEKSRMPSSGYLGAWCYCKSSSMSGYCRPREATPEQVNLQIASADTVVVAFVTYELTQNATPFVMWGEEEASLTNATGVTHHYLLPAVDPDPQGGIPPAPPAAAVESHAMTSDLWAKEARTGAFVAAHANGTAFEGMGGDGARRRVQKNMDRLTAAIGPGALTVGPNSSFCWTGTDTVVGAETPANSAVTVGWTGVTNPGKTDQLGLWCPKNSSGEMLAYSWLPCRFGGACTSSGEVGLAGFEHDGSLLAKIKAGETCEFRYCRADDNYCGPAKPANFAAVSVSLHRAPLRPTFSVSCPVSGADRAIGAGSDRERLPKASWAAVPDALRQADRFETARQIRLQGFVWHAERGHFATVHIHRAIR